MNGEERLDCEVLVNEMRLEYVSEFKYLGCVLDESSTDEVAGGRKLQVLLGPWLMLGVCS